MRANERNALSDILLHNKLLTPAAFNTANKNAALFNQSLFSYLTQHRLIPPEDFAIGCATYFNNQAKSIFYEEILFEKLPLTIQQKTLIFPICIEKSHYTFAVCNPLDRDIALNLSFQLKGTVTLQWLRYDFATQYHNHYMSRVIYQSQQVKEIADYILSDAIHRQASDIHLEPNQHCFRIRFRIDGLLKTIAELSPALHEGIVSCLKVLAQMDIAIKRMPQDGRLSFHSYLGFYKNCRVNTCPTQHGEKMVIRLLDHQTHIHHLQDLGLSQQQESIILNTIQKPQGLILVTGPTGSGKSITLYTLLTLLNQTHRNIVTVEDPIEMQLSGINQTNIYPKTGLTFSHTLRTLLRQDPDIMMIGEIRDEETAHIAIRAAETGHLVLSTLHTNSAAEAITRLQHMGIAFFHLASALSLIIAQRLVRKICRLCDGKGCLHCHDGYQGRLGIFELLPVDTTLQKMIFSEATHLEIDAYNATQGNKNLTESARDAMLAKKTSLEEINRILGKAV